MLVLTFMERCFSAPWKRSKKKIRSVHKNDEKIIIIRLRSVRIIDATGAHSLEQFLQEVKKKNVRVIFTNVKDSALKTIRNSGLINEIGEENIAIDTTEAIKLAVEKYANHEACRQCWNKVFEECKSIR